MRIKKAHCKSFVPRLQASTICINNWREELLPVIIAHELFGAKEVEVYPCNESHADDLINQLMDDNFNVEPDWNIKLNQGFIRVIL